MRTNKYVYMRNNIIPFCKKCHNITKKTVTYDQICKKNPFFKDPVKNAKEYKLLDVDWNILV